MLSGFLFFLAIMNPNDFNVDHGLYSLFIFVNCRSRVAFGFCANMGLKIGLSPFVIGVTIVALGTSLPELISAVVSII